MTTSEPAATPPNAPEKNPYQKTLNLPSTPFPMKANLVQNEPASLKRWGGLYARVRAARAGRERYVFHDGPPYANGSIHIGHLVNKCLKDFVARSRTQLGFDCPYIPGWDCHGLPIEHKVMTDMVESAKIEKLRTLTVDQQREIIRRECRRHAEKWIKVQGDAMKRLLTLADYEHPYLTMDPVYEGATLEVLAGLVEQGVIYRALKPVHWSIANETALADAELEYEDREDPSIFVEFESADPDRVYAAFGLPDGEDDDGEPSRPGQRPTFMIWTTTPWTLPANQAVAVHPDAEYSLVLVDGSVTVLATALVERVAKAGRAEDVRTLATAPGKALVGLAYRHPFLGEADGAPPTPRRFTLVAAAYVTLDDGTGLVHTAPGHGTEDFQTGQKEGLAVYCPVRADGSYDASVPQWLRGMDIWKANDAIVARLRESGHMFHDHRFTHSYPHDWRSKTPVIFRCTEQWFVGVDRPLARNGKTIREATLDAVGSRISFYPEWGRNRLRGMLESRPDWCISRQRAWGLPIPAFFWTDAAGKEHVLLTQASIRAVVPVVRAKGSDAWFSLSAFDLLAGYDPSTDPACPGEIAGRWSDFLASARKGQDILDVWFESGSSWNAVIRERSSGSDFPAALYLEGSDQHRGWFQSSLLPSVGVTGEPAFRGVLTHGFVVDKDGRKMSKSVGNTLEVEDLLRGYGADVLRWWVCSLAYENDVRADRSFLDAAGESYRKVRNTIRFLLGNLADFDPSVPVAAPSPTSLDAWALSELDRVRAEVVNAYERFEFPRLHKAVFDFCNDTLSAVYLAAAKDRLYCDRTDSPRRRSTQAAMHTIADALCRLLAPIMPHTADEAFRALRKASDPETCVHVEDLLPPVGVKADAAWPAVLRAREAALVALEKNRRGGGVENPLDAGVVLPDPEAVLERFDLGDLADLLGVSRVSLDAAANEPRVLDLRSEPRCDRSWKRDGTVRRRTDGGMLSDRDAAALGVT